RRIALGFGIRSPLNGEWESAGSGERTSVDEVVFILTLGTSAAAGTFALQSRSRLTGDDLFGNAIGFIFVRIAGLAYTQLRLCDPGGKQSTHRLVPQRPRQILKRWVQRLILRR
ncbi:MAG TPA: hypothetical protein VLK33_00885, partial [Terriglobales bacterium]|nr:hypothetical protein [Terriglobales bacterium]